MTWPNDRLKTYAANDPVRSNDLNLMQDAIIAGQKGTFYPTTPAAGATANTVGGAAGSYQNGYWLHTTIYEVDYPLHLAVGDRFSAVRVDWYSDGTGSFQLKLFKRDSTSGGDVVVDTGVGTAGLQTEAIGTTGQRLATYALTAPVTVAAGEYYYMRVYADGSQRSYGVTPTADHP
ncbi:MAG: hypothetical protein KC464_27680 [Myxococcales bacterium]|nr:hypothetical protein [Myxococcales bacterium]